MRYQVLFRVMLVLGVGVLSLSTSSQELTIACEADLPPFSFEEQGEEKGIVVEIVNALLQRLGREESIQLFPWARLYEMGLQNENIMIGAITHTGERDSLFQWCGDIVVSPLVLLALKDRDDITEMSEVEDLEPYTIGTLRNSQREQYLMNKGLMVGVHLESAATYRQNYLKLKRGRIDLWSASVLSAYAVIRDEGDRPSEMVKIVYHMKDLPQSMELAFSRRTPVDIVNAFREALEQLKRDGTYDTILRNWLE